MEPNNITNLRNEQPIQAESNAANPGESLINAVAREAFDEQRELLNRVNADPTTLYILARIALRFPSREHRGGLKWFIENLYSKRIDRATALDIVFPKVENDPVSVLNQLYDSLISENHNFPDFYIVFFEASGVMHQGIDNGGLSRDFVANLFNALVSKQNELTFEKVDQSDTFIPILKENKATFDELRGFAVLGRLMGICLCNPHKEMRIPPIFDLSVFQAIINIDPREPANSSFYLKIFESLDEKNKEVCELLSLESFDLSQKKRALEFAFLGEIPEGYHLKTPEEQHEMIKEAIWANYKILRKAIPLSAMAKGLELSLLAAGSRLKEVREHGSAVEMYSIIQGIKISEENVMRSYARALEPSQRKEFFERWIKEASQESLQFLVLACTGSLSAPIGDSIRINVRDTNDIFFEFFSCFNEIRIPDIAEKIDYQTFSMAIQSVISVSGYNKA